MYKFWISIDFNYDYIMEFDSLLEAHISLGDSSTIIGITEFVPSLPKGIRNNNKRLRRWLVLGAGIQADVMDSTNVHTMETVGETELKHTDVEYDLTEFHTAHWRTRQEVNRYLREEYHAVHETLWHNGYSGSLWGTIADHKQPPLQRAAQLTGCRISGSVMVNKVAGNLHVTMGRSPTPPVSVNNQNWGSGILVRAKVELISWNGFEAVPNMEADAFAADSNMSTDAAPPYPGVGPLLRSINRGWCFDRHLPHAGGHIHISLFPDFHTNFSHRIERFSFGESSTGIFDPLEGEEKLTNHGNYRYQYYIQVVPTDVVSLSGRVTSTYQYSVTEQQRGIDHESNSHGTPGINFRYQFFPLKVRVIKYTAPQWKFAVRVVAMLGGVHMII
ncbi:ERGIC2, partial [Cordylochernes scorpioides]